MTRTSNTLADASRGRRGTGGAHDAEGVRDIFFCAVDFVDEGSPVPLAPSQASRTLRL